MGKKKTERTPPESLGLPKVGVDSHAHLDLKHFAGEVDAVLDRAAAAGVAQVGQVFMGVDAYLRGRELFANRPEVWFLLGVHPNDSGTVPDLDAELAAITQAFREDARLKSVGETGLDFYWDKVAPEVQETAFRAHLELARQLDAPVVVHSRDAFEATLAVLDDMGFARRPVLWHCFGEGSHEAREIARRGWMASIPGPVTYKANEALRRAVAELGVERLMVETDCPYLTPEPWRGKRNEPALAVFTGVAVAQALDMDPAEAWQRLGDNARDFFGMTSG